MKIALADILIPNPTVLDADGELQVKELADSVQEMGLSHPIIVRPANIQGGQPYILATGEKRLLAHKLLGLESIDAEVRDLDENKGKILRVHENLKRSNMPFWDACLLVEELHRLRQAEHGAKADPGPGRPKASEGKTWGVRETAAELGMALGAVSDDMSLARAVKANPSLRNVKDKKTAVRLVRIAAQRHNTEIEASAPSVESYNEAFFGDAVVILQQFPDRTFDHCVSDPPWLKFFDPSLTYDARTVPVFKEVYRVLKSNSFLVFFCGLDDYHYYCGTDLPGADGNLVHTRGVLEQIGFTVSKTPAIWQKESALSRRGVRAWEYDRDFEFVVVAVKGSPVMVHPTAVSAFKKRPIVPVAHLIHANEKPVSVVEDFIKDISFEGQLILDPFGGSGVTAIACRNLKRRWIVCERDPEAFKKIQRRLEKK